VIETDQEKERTGLTELSGNIILITGGTSGIGVELATQLSKKMLFLSW
jgi:short-subunit dehydrogenase